MASTPVSAMLGDLRSPPVRWDILLTRWQHDPLTWVAILFQIAGAVWYLAGVRRLKLRGQKWSPWRTVSFLAGIVVIAFSVESGMGWYDDKSFTTHVAQHLLLMNLAPPLLALGAPMTLTLQSSQRRTKTVILKVLHSKPLVILTHPLVAAASAVGTMYIYFLTSLYTLSESNQYFHDYAHLHFLIAGCLYWWPIVGVDVLPRRWSYPAKIGLLFASIPWNAFLGLAISSSTRSIDPAVHTLSDTQAGGDLLWAAGELFTIGALVVIFVSWASQEERAARRLDRQLDAMAVANLESPVP